MLVLLLMSEQALSNPGKTPHPNFPTTAITAPSGFFYKFQMIV